MDTCGQLGRGGDNTWLRGMLADKLDGERTDERPRNKPCFPNEKHKELRCQESICLQIKT